MNSTPGPKGTEAADVLIVRADEGEAYQQIMRADYHQIVHADEQHRMQRSTPRARKQLSRMMS
jgi:hypothetical protein